MTDLTTCPFCGSDELYIIGTCIKFVRCESCETDGPKGYDEKEAEELWNRRFFND